MAHASITNTNNKDSKKKCKPKFNKNHSTNLMWTDDIDSPQVSIGGGFREVPTSTEASLQVHDLSMSFAIQESLDHMTAWGHRDSGMITAVASSSPFNDKKGKAENGDNYKTPKIIKENVEEKKQELKTNEGLEEFWQNPIGRFGKNRDGVRPAIYNRDFCVLDCPHSLLNPDELKQAVVLKLNKLVSEGFVDWDYESKYTFEGRIYKKNEDAGFRITIYLLNEEDECVLEVRRNGGDSFLFHEFKSKFLGLMSDDKSIINYEKTGKFTMECGFFSLLDDDDDDDDDVLLSESEDLLTPLSSSSSSVNDNNNNFDANRCVEEAINTKKYGVLRYRHCVAFLRNCSDNDIKLNKILKVENVIDKLLIPINGNDKIYDTLVIKSLLEVIYKIVCKDNSLASQDNEKAIKKIKVEWSKKILHPYGGKFCPSQQIQWICHKCIEKFSNCYKDTKIE